MIKKDQRNFEAGILNAISLLKLIQYLSILTL